MLHEKTTVPNPSVGADGEQPLSKESTGSISEKLEKSKDHSQELFRKIQEMQSPDYLHTVTLDELFDSVYTGSPPIVEGLLWPGAYLFVGAPKVGKSFMVAQIAYHVSMGIDLWGLPVHQGTVLYLALEDDYKRLQQRLYRMYGTEGTEKLHFAVCAKQLENGLEGQLTKFVTEHPDTKLIIIDTLQKVREQNSERYSYAGDYALIANLKAFAGTHNICLLLVHHTRKQESENKFNMISGTNGLLGAADGVFLLQKINSLKADVKLDISGRDMPESQLTFRREPETLCWEMEHMYREDWSAPPDPLLERINAMLLIQPEEQWKGSSTQLAQALKLEISPVSLTKQLNVNAENLLQDYQIRYNWSRLHEGRVITLQRLRPPA